MLSKQEAAGTGQAAMQMMTKHSGKRGILLAGPPSGVLAKHVAVVSSYNTKAFWSLECSPRNEIEKQLFRRSRLRQEAMNTRDNKHEGITNASPK